MADTQFENQIINHLEFLGYEVQPVPNVDPSGKMSMLRAEHPSSGSINIMLFENAVNFSIWFSLNDFAMTSKQSLLGTVNNLNRELDGKYYVGEAGETPAFFCSLSYLGPYEKKTFGQFVSSWQGQIQALWGAEIRRFLA